MQEQTTVIKPDVEVAVLSPLGIIENGYIIYNDDRVKNGSIVVKDKEGNILKVHPDRVLYTLNGANSLAVHDESGRIFAVCPICNKAIMVADKTADTFDCPQHGQYKFYTGNKTKPVKTKKPSSPPNKPLTKYVDFDKISQLGELWIKDDVGFDYDRTEVQSCCMIFEKQNKYITFNIYNGSYGRKNTRPPIEEILSGADVGYDIKNITLLRNKYSTKGYVKYSK